MVKPFRGKFFKKEKIDSKSSTTTSVHKYLRIKLMFMNDWRAKFYSRGICKEIDETEMCCKSTIKLYKNSQEIWKNIIVQ